jgi:nucleoside-diphosphate-sugar epimerase
MLYPSTEPELEDLLTRPGAELIRFMGQIREPLVVLGAGGKMGPTLCLLARRAAEAAGRSLRIVAVSRFGTPATRQWFAEHNLETISCDLQDRSALPGLPDAGDVIYLVGQKFGTSRDPATTWAANTIPPGLVVERYPDSRIVALSTGNVYPMVPLASGGATENTPTTPVGEYANAAVARERLFEFHSRRARTPLALLRLNYAVELRYGVLHDIAARIARHEPVDVRNGWFNCLWQADANERILRALGHATYPPLVLNLTGPETLSVRTVATRLAELLGHPVRFEGAEGSSALLANTARSLELFGPPRVTVDEAIQRVAAWFRAGGRSLNKPTHFEVVDGRF